MASGNYRSVCSIISKEIPLKRPTQFSGKNSSPDCIVNEWNPKIVVEPKKLFFFLSLNPHWKPQLSPRGIHTTSKSTKANKSREDEQVSEEPTTCLAHSSPEPKIETARDDDYYFLQQQQQDKDKEKQEILSKENNVKEMKEMPGPSPSLPLLGTNWIYFKSCEFILVHYSL